jgi:SAM-dependent methyltransferase
MTPVDSPTSDGMVERHYGRLGAAEIADAILTRLAAGAGAVTAGDLAAFDQLHTRGVIATRALARRAALTAGENLLDIGSGLGGPARLLAAEFDVRVAGIDLTDSFCEAAWHLTRRAGLSNRVTFRRANALALPFSDAAFDVVWSQHVGMNVADKAALYREARRVLRAGGRLALHEIIAGPTGTPHFPLPWARDPGDSFLLGEAPLREMLDAHFETVAWEDVTPETTAWNRETQAQRRALPAGAPPPIPALIFGSDFATAADNLLRNFEEGRIAVVEAVLKRR